MNALIDALNRIPKIELGLFPTALHRLKNLERVLNYKNLFIKRDDMTGLGPGGNKIRSLEFILAEAMEKHCKTIIVCGPLQSNLCTLTACACAKLNLKCITVHNAEKPQNYTGNMLLNKLLNVESLFLGNISSEERNSYAQQLAENITSKGDNPYIVVNGGTSGVGALGYVSACLEIFREVRDKKYPIKTIFAPGGNGGVAAGLVYGNALLGNFFNIVIVSVESEKEKLAADIYRTIKESENLLGLDFNLSLEEACLIVDDYRGGGWGVNTKESEIFVHRLPQLEGIFVENVYTSKVLVAIEDFITRKKISDGICYIHTGGLGSLFSQY